MVKAHAEERAEAADAADDSLRSTWDGLEATSDIHTYTWDGLEATSERRWLS